MSGEERRNQIIHILQSSDTPISGVKLAKMLDVSRQVIVQDVALLRAKDICIHSTNRGYVIDKNQETLRSEERRVGKECRSRWSPYH